MSERFSREQHLRQKRDFEHARNRGIRIFRPGFIFQAVQRDLKGDPSLPAVRLGVIASRKVGKAHDRNLARRRIREIFRKHQHTIPPGHDLVVILRVGVHTQTFEEIRDDFLSCLKRLSSPARTE